MTVVQKDVQEGCDLVVGPATPTDTPLPGASLPPKRHHHNSLQEAELSEEDLELDRGALGGYNTNPFQTQHLFDESTDLDAYEDQDISPNHQPQQYQIRTGSRRGELSDSPHSMLSMIPEEDMESYDSSQKSHDSRYRSHEQSPVPDIQSNANSGRGMGGVTPPPLPASPLGEVAWSEEVPWYQESSAQDVWQTTPAYTPKGHGEWSDEGSTQNQRRLSSVQKVVVTEEIVPVLQVRLIIMP